MQVEKADCRELHQCPKTSKTNYGGKTEKTVCRLTEIQIVQMTHKMIDLLVCQINGNSSPSMNVPLQIKNIPFPPVLCAIWGRCVNPFPFFLYSHLLSPTLPSSFFPSSLHSIFLQLFLTLHSLPSPLSPSLPPFLPPCLPPPHYTPALFAVERNWPSLFGSSWLQHICLDYKWS